MLVPPMPFCLSTICSLLLTPAVYTYDGDRSKADILKFVAYRRTTEPGKLKKEGGKKEEGSKDEEKDEL